MNRKYSAFTLVEMLIVMGILIILMAVGITAGRFAINRANDVAHQNAADQIYTALQAYYTDEREYPSATEMPDFGTGMATGGVLAKYMGDGEFTGGTDATFYYWLDDLGQSVLVCVSKGGHSDETHRGFYCTGNGFGAAASGIETKDVPNTGTDTAPAGVAAWEFPPQDWDGTDKEWTAAA